MQLLTADQYETLTGATAPADFDDVEARVVAALEGALDRGLTATERVERLAVYCGSVFPATTPLVAVTKVEVPVRGDAGTWDELDVDWFDDIEIGVIGASNGEWVAVTLVGGWDTDTVPADVAEGVAWAIHTTQHPDPEASTSVDGVLSESVAGEYSVTRQAGITVGADGQQMPAGAPAALRPFGGRAATLLLPHRAVRVL